MKKFLSILLLFVCHFAQSQTVPQGINYQAVALDQSGQPIPGIDIVGRPIDDAEIGVRIAILENAPTGNVLYEEEHEVLTDLYGMFNLVIGQGLQVSVDPFSSINWQGDKFLQVELSIENNGEFVLSAVQQLMSVPYAFLAENAIVAQTAVDVDDADADPSNELQSLSVTGDSLTLSSGNTVQLPAIDDADADPNNEIQVLSISNDTLFLSNGGFAVLPVDQVNDADADPSNEIQTLSKSGNTISLTNGGSVTVFDGDYNNLSNTPTIPTKTSDLTNDSGFITAEGDSSTTNELQALSISNDTIYLTSGGYVVLPAGFDGDYNSLTNTPAIPTKTSDLTNDNGFITTEQDSSVTNELQTLSISNDTIFISDGGYVRLPGSVTNNQQIGIQSNPDSIIENQIWYDYYTSSLKINVRSPAQNETASFGSWLNSLPNEWLEYWAYFSMRFMVSEDLFLRKIEPMTSSYNGNATFAVYEDNDTISSNGYGVQVATYISTFNTSTNSPVILEKDKFYWLVKTSANSSSNQFYGNFVDADDESMPTSKGLFINIKQEDGAVTGYPAFKLLYNQIELQTETIIDFRFD